MAMDGNNSGYVDRTIIRQGSLNKMMDFSSGLVAAHQDQWAMVHGVGGKKAAPRSCIKVSITDTSASPNVHVSGNMSYWESLYLLEVCRKNIGSPVADTTKGAWPMIAKAIKGYESSKRLLTAIAGLLCKLINACMRACSDAIKGTEPRAAFGAKLKELRDWAKSEFAEPTQEGSDSGENWEETGMPLPISYDINYSLDRVNTYAPLPDGYVPVTHMEFIHNCKRRYPWTVRISNFEAQPKPRDNGTTAYVSSTARNKKEANFPLSEPDMFKCLTAVEHHVRLWEDMVCGPIMKDGWVTKEVARLNNAPSGYSPVTY